MKKKGLIATATVAAIFITVQAVALIRCEILTHKYYSDFNQAYKQNNIIERIDYFKVLKCNSKTAEVYYVEAQNSVASLLCFKRDGDGWVETSWNTVWSSTGSASNVVWPYWWHFICCGF